MSFHRQIRLVEISNSDVTDNPEEALAFPFLYDSDLVIRQAAVLRFVVLSRLSGMKVLIAQAADRPAIGRPLRESNPPSQVENLMS